MLQNEPSYPFIQLQQMPELSIEDMLIHYMIKVGVAIVENEVLLQNQVSSLAQSEQPPQPPLKDLLVQNIAKTDDRLSEIEAILQNQIASLKNLEVQVSKIVDLLSTESQGTPSGQAKAELIDEVIGLPYEPMDTFMSRFMVDDEDIIPYEQKLENYEMSAPTAEHNDTL